MFRPSPWLIGLIAAVILVVITVLITVIVSNSAWQAKADYDQGVILRIQHERDSMLAVDAMKDARIVELEKMPDEIEDYFSDKYIVPGDDRAKQDSLLAAIRARYRLHSSK